MLGARVYWGMALPDPLPFHCSVVFSNLSPQAIIGRIAFALAAGDWPLFYYLLLFAQLLQKSKEGTCKPSWTMHWWGGQRTSGQEEANEEVSDFRGPLGSHGPLV